VLSLLDTEDERVRDAAIMALSLIEDPDGVQAMILQAGAASEKTRAMAMRALGRAPRTEAGVTTLLAGTKDDDSWVRYYAAQALGRLAVLEALPALTQLLTDPAVQVRISAVEALSHLPSAEAFAALAQAAASSESDLRRAAILGFGSLKRDEAVPLLLAALASDDPATRLVAVSALGHFHGSDAVRALGHAANDSDESVRLTAIGLLADIASPEATLCLIRLLPEYRNLDRVRLALSAASAGRIEAILLALADADDETAAILTSALARMRTSESLAALKQALSIENVASRKAAATVLGAVGVNDALDELKRVARDDADPEVRRIAALAAARA
jgi:HEAT repeat protein